MIVAAPVAYVAIFGCFISIYYIFLFFVKMIIKIATFATLCYVRKKQMHIIIVFCNVFYDTDLMTLYSVIDVILSLLRRTLFFGLIPTYTVTPDISPLIRALSVGMP